MEQTSTLAGRVQERLDQIFENQTKNLADLGDDVLPLLSHAQAFLNGGKRLRARFASASYACVAGTLDPLLEAVPECVINAAAALELFHAAALIHDDIIDRSDTRRGNPAIHKSFSALHQKNGWRSNSENFGIAAAILIGDLLQSWADEVFSSALSELAPQTASRAREHFNRMRTEVAAGQYLDVLEEQMGAFGLESEELERATRVLVYKSAKYSVEAPLLIGAALAGASADQEDVFREFGLPVGVAFQLRDDVLGVFGDESVTGKPAGDDLREGKRTVLVGLTRQHLPISAKRVFDELLGDAQLTEEQVSMMQRTMRDSGALDSVEKMIDGNVSRAFAALNASGFSASTVAELRTLAERATRRDS